MAKNNPHRQSIKTAGLADPDDSRYWEQKTAQNHTGTILFSQTIFMDWCKACGICVAFCPQNVYSRNPVGKPEIIAADACNGCRFCELHCPDFAITIRQRFADRRGRAG